MTADNRRVVREWLHELHGRSPGYFSLVAFEQGKVSGIKWYTAAQIDRAANTIDKHEHVDWYVSVATQRELPDRGRGKTSTTRCIPGFWLDLDVGTEGHKAASLPNPATAEEALSLLEGLPTPTARIWTGGGLQVWWLFDEPWVYDDPNAAGVAADAFTRTIVRRGEERGLHVDALGDLSRIMRVPGTYNQKTGTPRLTYHTHPMGSRYHASVLEALGTYIDKDTPSAPGEDTFPLSWEQILGPHGYTVGGTDAGSGGTFVTRPGKRKSEGHSGVVSPYGVPVYVNYSASDPVLPSGPGQRLTKLRVYALLNHDGDLKAAAKDIAALMPEDPEQFAKVAQTYASAKVNWPDLWERKEDDVQWLIEPLVERGGQTCIFSEAKAGKSILLFEAVLALATGGEFLGRTLPESDVLYIDMENTESNLREHGTHMGYHGNPLEHLHYYSFPNLDWLDTPRGGFEVYALARYHNAALVVIDTVSRVVEGGENDADTYHSFYKHTGTPLKRGGIALLRLDHAGKDVLRGMRGSSGKTTDVDDIWQLTATKDPPQTVELKRTHTRMAHGAGELSLIRMDEPKLHHRLLVGPEPAAPALDPDLADAVAYLELVGVVVGDGLVRAWASVKDDPARPKSCTREMVREAQRVRQGLE